MSLDGMQSILKLLEYCILYIDLFLMYKQHTVIIYQMESFKLISC